MAASNSSTGVFGSIKRGDSSATVASGPAGAAVGGFAGPAGLPAGARGAFDASGCASAYPPANRARIRTEVRILTGAIRCWTPGRCRSRPRNLCPCRDGRHREAADPRLTYPKRRQPAKTTHFIHFHMGSQALGSELGAIWANSSDLAVVPEPGLFGAAPSSLAERYVSNRSDLTSARVQPR